jgi:hypothetical protein
MMQSHAAIILLAPFCFFTAIVDQANHKKSLKVLLSNTFNDWLEFECIALYDIASRQILLKN